MIISTFYNHGHAVGGKADLFIRVEVGDGLDQADAPHLEQVIGAFPPFVKTLDHAEYQPQIPLDELFPGLFIPSLGQTEQCVHFLVGQRLQPCGVDAADFYLSLHGLPPFSVKEVFPFPG